MKIFDIRVELTDIYPADEVITELDIDPLHRLHEYRPRIKESASGRTIVELRMTGPDLWTGALASMAVLQAAGYQVQTLQIETRFRPHGALVVDHPYP